MAKSQYDVGLCCSLSDDESGIDSATCILIPDRAAELTFFGLREKIEASTGVFIDSYSPDTYFSPQETQGLLAILKESLVEIEKQPDEWQLYDCIASKKVVRDMMQKITELAETCVSRNGYFVILGQ